VCEGDAAWRARLDALLAFVHELATASLRSGTSTVAVEVHQSERTSSDLVFDLEILALRKK